MRRCVISRAAVWNSTRFGDSSAKKSDTFAPTMIRNTEMYGRGARLMPKPSWCHRLSCGKRDLATAKAFVGVVASRMANRVQISADALRAYVDAIEQTFGTEVDRSEE